MLFVLVLLLIKKMYLQLKVRYVEDLKFSTFDRKPFVFPVHVGETSSFDVEQLGSGCTGTPNETGSSQHPVNSSMQSQLNQVNYEISHCIHVLHRLNNGD